MVMIGKDRRYTKVGNLWWVYVVVVVVALVVKVDVEQVTGSK